jgi:hypothetical protein
MAVKNRNEKKEGKEKKKITNSTFIAVLHFTVTVGSSNMRITHTLKLE